MYVYVYLVFGRIALCKVERFGIALIDKQYAGAGWLVFGEHINWDLCSHTYIHTYICVR